MVVPIISLHRADVLENNSGSSGNSITFTIMLSEVSDADIVVSYRTNMGTAVEADMWTAMGIGKLTIPAGQLTGQITFRTYGDTIDEVDESFWLQLFNPKGATFAGDQQTLQSIGVIQDDDGGGSNLSLFVSDASVTEGNSGSKSATFEVHLSQAYSEDLTFTYRTVNGTAKAGSDYVAKTGSITFAAGQTTALVDIALKSDTVIEASEFFSLVLTPTAEIKNGTLSSTGMAYILDDDAGRSAMPTISMTQVAVTENNSGSSGTLVNFAVTLSRAFDEDVSIEYRARPGTAIEGDFWSGIGTGKLVIPAGETVGIIALRTYGDQLDEVDESFWIDLFNVKGGKFAGGYNTLSTMGVLHDNDGTGSNLSLFVSDAKVTEGNSGTKVATFEIHLSRAFASDLTFTYETADGSARAGSDYVAKSGNVTFLAGQTAATVDIAIRGDGLAELNEFFSLVLKPTAEIKNLTDGSTGIGTILDNDTKGGLPIVSVERTDVVENNSGSSGTIATFTVNLSKASADDITIGYQISPGTASTADFWSSLGTGTLTMAAGQTTALIRARTYGDGDDEVDESFWLTLFNPNGCTFAGGATSTQTIGILRDNDGGGSNLGLFVSNVEVTEGNSGKKTAVFEVHLSQPYSQDLSFSYKTADGTAKAGSDYVARSGTVKFLAGQTVAAVEVEIIGDRALEARENFSLILTPTAEIKNGTLGSAGTAFIQNDDTIHEVLYGTAKADTIAGGTGRDQIYGRAGNDRLFGDEGNDTLRGENGADKLVGGAGADKLYGGAGADTFIFKTVADSKVAAASRDTIFDFRSSQGDKVDLSAIDANAKAGGNQAFTFIGDDAFSGKAGELRYQKSASDTYVYADVNGDRKADFAIHFDDALSFAKGHFLL